MSLVKYPVKAPRIVSIASIFRFLSIEHFCSECYNIIPQLGIFSSLAAILTGTYWFRRGIAVAL